jgi:hypothetical protein
MKEFFSENGLILVFLGIVGLILAYAGCTGCFKKGMSRDVKVTSCSVHDLDEDNCNAARQVDEKRCRFDTATGNCLAGEAKLMPCPDMSRDECRESKFCTFQDMTNKCVDADPGLVGTCDVIQDRDPCNADNLCQWNDKAMVCQAKEK